MYFDPLQIEKAETRGHTGAGGGRGGQAETRVSRGAPGSPEDHRGWEGAGKAPARSLRGSVALPTPGFRFWPPGLGEATSLLSRAMSPWCLVTRPGRPAYGPAALGVGGAAISGWNGASSAWPVGLPPRRGLPLGLAAATPDAAVRGPQAEGREGGESCFCQESARPTASVRPRRLGPGHPASPEPRPSWDPGVHPKRETGGGPRASRCGCSPPPRRVGVAWGARESRCAGPDATSFISSRTVGRRCHGHRQDACGPRC